MVLQNKSDNSTVHHALQSCQIQMVLQNKPDNSNGHPLKWSNQISFRMYHFEDVYRRNVPIFAKTSWETKIFAKLRENLLIFASFSLFAKMEKNVFVSTLVQIRNKNNYWVYTVKLSNVNNALQKIENEEVLQKFYVEEFNFFILRKTTIVIHLLLYCNRALRVCTKSKTVLNWIPLYACYHIILSCFVILFIFYLFFYSPKTNEVLLVGKMWLICTARIEVEAAEWALGSHEVLQAFVF
jgi:hypothetical protein